SKTVHITATPVYTPPRPHPPPRQCLKVPRNAGHSRLEIVDPGEDQSEAREDGSERARLATRDQPEKGADAEDGKGRGGNPEPKAEERHHPRGRRRSERCADVDRDRLGKGDQPRPPEPHAAEDGRGGGLSHNRQDRSGYNRAESAGNELLEYAAQGVARESFQTLSEVVDAEQKHADSTQELHDRGGVHGFPFVRRVTAPKP